MYYFRCQSQFLYQPLIFCVVTKITFQMTYSHPSIFSAYPGQSRRWQSQQRCQNFPIHAHLLQLDRGDPAYPAERHSPSSVSQVFPGVQSRFIVHIHLQHHKLVKVVLLKRAKTRIGTGSDICNQHLIHYFILDRLRSPIPVLDIRSVQLLLLLK